MRGKALSAWYKHHFWRITPAYAGKRYPNKRHERKRKDHPRVCGEKCLTSLTEISAIWITPAYAGKRAMLNVQTSFPEDHPRVCGEKVPRLTPICAANGSPPRMRGKDLENPDEARHTRITPAYAGKRRRSSTAAARTRDHPRVCGEKTLYNGIQRVVLGSPPRMRGKD